MLARYETAPNNKHPNSINTNTTPHVADTAIEKGPCCRRPINHPLSK